MFPAAAARLPTAASEIRAFLLVPYPSIKPAMAVFVCTEQLQLLQFIFTLPRLLHLSQSGCILPVVNHEVLDGLLEELSLCLGDITWWTLLRDSWILLVSQ
jgi:hypothetical protein